MKLEAKEYTLKDGDRPKVLFLGNGVNLSYEGVSWDKLLDDIKDKETYKQDSTKYILPMPLKAAMLTSNSLNEKMKEIKRDRWNDFAKASNKQIEYINAIVECGFEYVITTNYSYEIECSLNRVKEINEYSIKDMMSFHKVDNAQTTYLINTYNKTKTKTGNSVEIWHIHGEARKPGSMVLGHSYYGNLLCKCNQYYEEVKENNSKRLKDNKTVKMNSWVDLFLYGDVYILGFGMQMSEFDLWWLLGKKQYVQGKGKTVFFEPLQAANTSCLADKDYKCEHRSEFITEDKCKLDLFRLYGGEVRNLGITIKKDSDYVIFYDKALEELKTGKW